MISAINPESCAEVDFMLHAPIYQHDIEPFDNWPAPLEYSTSPSVFCFKLQSGQEFYDINFELIPELFGLWFANDSVYSAHLKICFPENDSNHKIDIRVVDTQFRRIKFYSENGAYLPLILLYYQNAHKSRVLDLFVHKSGRFWIELIPERDEQD